ncbi:hypothetical protein Cylst_1630 [Cylindrospermum stagnale PCC 7417]|uniref:Uncharacterized protein n=1 Tax=Cylindrospermum stagnale PCC 7417 TaxID=56107 RepID=K9WUM1_9NOST|nr:hypothetical protein [Cylindrospermum stagnale]AFZ23908.1 hypothetical protein Cylst_1630 [Cylindrospermum stagnale PCC 7417]
MSYYYSIRGWLEITPDRFVKVVEKIKSLQESYINEQKLGLYMNGWCWSETPINWSRYIFYGADVTEEGIKLLELTLQEIANLKCQVSGYFHIQGEDGEINFLYKLNDDLILFQESDLLIDIS